jgi:hypothetical protein
MSSGYKGFCFFNGLIEGLTLNIWPDFRYMQCAEATRPDLEERPCILKLSILHLGYLANPAIPSDFKPFWFNKGVVADDNLGDSLRPLISVADDMNIIAVAWGDFRPSSPEDTRKRPRRLGYL